MMAAHFDQDAPAVCQNCGAPAAWIWDCGVACNLCVELWWPDGIDPALVHPIWLPAEVLDDAVAQFEADYRRAIDRTGAIVLAVLALALGSLGTTLTVAGRPAGITLGVIAVAVAVLAYGLWPRKAGQR